MCKAVGRQNIARWQNQSLGDKLELGCSDKILAMIRFDISSAGFSV
jgi:hypothetical protein